MITTPRDKFTLSPGELKCGLEIHQQLEGTKLHCHCPTLITDEITRTKITRQLRSVIGETGTHDIAALQQSQRNKTFTYEAPTTSTCLIDLDEAPPTPLNKEALTTTLQLCKLLNCTIVDEAHTMRKIVIDGSNTTGFQRTTLTGMNGTLTTSTGTIGIQTVVLEEDSARLLSTNPTTTTYKLDRLGIPLIEIATAPDITTPEQAKLVAETLGLLIRATGKAKRGLGTIRQDLNVSITTGNRVELKGAQDLKLIPEYIIREALRQHNIVTLAPTLKKIFLQPPLEVTSHLSATASKMITNAIAGGKRCYAARVNGAKGILGTELQPNKRVATELSDYAKQEVGITGLLHSDELPGYGLTDVDVNALLNATQCNANDGFILVIEEERTAYRAFTAITERLHQLTNGVPTEVRKALPDGNSSYLRAMPGASRMYPETDVPPTIITQQLLDNLPLTETYESKAQRYHHDGLSQDQAMVIAKSDKSELYEELSKLNVPKPFLAELLIAGSDMIQTKLGIKIEIPEEHYGIVLKAYSEGTITKEGVLPLLASANPEQELHTYSPLDDTELRRIIHDSIVGHEQEPLGALIGKTLLLLKGRADAVKVRKVIQEIVMKKK